MHYRKLFFFFFFFFFFFVTYSQLSHPRRDMAVLLIHI
jgi:hypothetical protein